MTSNPTPGRARATALITGATAGIGREFAEQLAASGHDLVLVARDTERLNQVAAQLETAHGVNAQVLAADLSVAAELDTVAGRVADRQQPVDVLINNAGYGLKTPFLDNDLDLELQMFDVLARAVLVLTHAAGRAMRERGHGTIVNVSSVAAFIASGSYSAAKSFVTVLTESLHEDLAAHGVRITALCPGFTHTEFHARADVDPKMPEFMWLNTSQVVRDALADAAAGRAVSVPSVQYKAVVTAARLLPRPLIRSGRIGNRHRPKT